MSACVVCNRDCTADVCRECELRQQVEAAASELVSLRAELECGEAVQEDLGAENESLNSDNECLRADAAAQSAELARLRAEAENHESIAKIHMDRGDHWLARSIERTAERDEARAENERLRAALSDAHQAMHSVSWGSAAQLEAFDVHCRAVHEALAAKPGEGGGR